MIRHHSILLLSKKEGEEGKPSRKCVKGQNELLDEAGMRATDIPVQEKVLGGKTCDLRASSRLCSDSTTQGSLQFESKPQPSGPVVYGCSLVERHGTKSVVDEVLYGWRGTKVERYKWQT